MARRDPAAFAEFVAARAGALQRTAYLMVGEVDLARDLVAEALTRTYVAWPRLKDPHRAEDHARRLVTRAAIAAVSEADPADRTGDTDPLWARLQGLPVRERAALVLRHHVDLPDVQVAEAVGPAAATRHGETGALTDLMDRRADALDPPLLDAGALVADGERRLARRRRRVTRGLVGSGLAVAIGVAAAALAGGQRTSGVDEHLVRAGDPVWATGSTIHADGRAVDVLHEVDRFVRTDEGFVLADPTGRVWSSVAGRVTPLGVIATDGALLSDGSRVAWDAADGTVQVLHAAGSPRVTRLPLANVRLVALDGSEVWYRDAQGIGRYDLRSHEDTLLLADPNHSYQLFDAEGGVLVHGLPGIGSGVVAVNASVTDGAPAFRLSDSPDLSPGATYLMSDGGGDFRVYAVSTGEELTPAQVGDYDRVIGYAWVNDDHYMALGLHGRGAGAPVDMLACSASERACAVTGDGGLRYGAFQLPDGDHIGD